MPVPLAVWLGAAALMVAAGSDILLQRYLHVAFAGCNGLILAAGAATSIGFQPTVADLGIAVWRR